MEFSTYQDMDQGQFFDLNQDLQTDGRLNDLVTKCMKLGEVLIAAINSHGQLDSELQQLRNCASPTSQNQWVNPSDNAKFALQYDALPYDNQVQALVMNLKQQHGNLMTLFQGILTDLQNLQSKILEVDLATWGQDQHLMLNQTVELADLELDRIQKAGETLAEIGLSVIVMLQKFRHLVGTLVGLEPEYASNTVAVNRLVQGATQTLNNLVGKSFVIDRQPHRVLQTITKFSVRGRFLVGSKLGFNFNPPVVQAYVVSEEQIQGIANIKKPAAIQGDHNLGGLGYLCNNQSIAEYDPKLDQVLCRFEQMSLVNLKRPPKSHGVSVTEEKFYLLFTSEVRVHDLCEPVHIQALSVPFVAVVH